MRPFRSVLSRKPAVWGAALLCIGASDVVAGKRVLRPFPLRGETAQSEARRRAYAERRTTLPAFLHDTSRNARLRERGLLTSARRRALRSGHAKAGLAALPDTVRVLLVRVGFEENVQPSLTSMSASGDFLLDPDPDVIIDPPPHDRLYFEKHLLAMRSYYDVSSYGQLVVDATVFPPAPDSSIKLMDVADYGPGANGFWTLESLEEYFRDAVQLLDQEAPPGFLDPYAYDSTGTRLGAIVFVHPGSDLQNDINRDSPNDLPTFYIALADSISIQGGRNEIRAGLIIPETTSQDGALGGIQGALCHEFGHALGLPDLYNTRLGLPVVGEWSLMDSGNAALHVVGVETEPGMPPDVFFVLGLLPTSLSAVDRYLLDWVDPYVFRAPSDSVRLRPSNADEFHGADPTAALLPVSPDEYFLLENRRDLYDLRFPQDKEASPVFNQDDETGVVLWMTKDASLPPEFRPNSAEYDFWISAPTAPEDAFGPFGELGFGIIVWHVDERALVDGLPTNSVNVSFTHRATRIIEASGDFEIGDFLQPSISFLGDGWNDPFREGYKTELREQTVPNNWNSDWARTGWEIDKVRPVPRVDEQHEVVVRTLGGVADWPQMFEVAPDTLAQVVPEGALAVAIDALGPQVVVADSTALYAFGAGGHTTLHRGAVQPASLAWARFRSESERTLGAVVDGRVWLWTARWNGTALDVRAGFPLDVPGGAGERLVLADSAQIGVVETADGAWMLFGTTPTTPETTLVDLEPSMREAGIVVGPLHAAWPGDEMALVSGARADFVSLENTSLRVSHPLPFGVGDTLFVGGGVFDARSMHAQVVVLHRDGRLRVVDPIDGVLSSYGDLPADDYLGMALGDVDGDGFVDMLATSATRLVGLNSLGAHTINTPRDVREIFALQVEVHVATPPLLADVSGDALPEILFATDLGLLYALDATGQLLPGYPRKALPDGTPAALVAGDLDGLANSLEVIGVSSINAAVFALPGGGAGGPSWSSLGAGPGRTAFATTDLDLVAEAGGRVRALERPFAAYPNPARSERSVQLRITARSEGPYEIRIYNLEGEEVWARSGMTRTGVQEIEWNVGALASGVYLCRFVSAAAGVTSPLVEPITLVH